ncbi:hypothetical protein [Heliomarina baculiformis]|uniref:hypothetical protein n=1 Tax=Heliomarina baculiformis TaxID=2872036 RepID=UPI001EE30D42|nr:hypothetical protein [Heliomarina baculiformis]
MGKLFLIAALSLFASGASASIVNIDISLRIDRIYWSGLELIYYDDDGHHIESYPGYDKGEIIPEFGQALDLMSPFPTRNVGDVIDFKATIDTAALDFGNAPSCKVDDYDCSFDSSYYLNRAQAGLDSFSLIFDTVDLVSFSGSTQPGGEVTMQWADDWGGGYEYIGGSKYLTADWRDNVIEMTVVQNNLSPAVMPLPSSLGFLLTGFLGLAATQARRFRPFNRSNRKHA